MDKYIRVLLGIIVCCLALASCSEKTLFEDGEATLMLKVKMQEELPIVTSRGSLTNLELLQKCKIYLRNDLGLIRKFNSYDEMPERIQLATGQYRAEVTAGDSVAASFTDSYFTGSSAFALTAGQTLSQSVVCKIRNLVTAVKVEDDLANAMPDYVITFSTSKGELNYTAQNIEELGYFIFPGDDTQLSWAFEGKTPDGKSISKKGVINQAKKKTKYLLTFSNSSSTEVGGGMIAVTVESKNLDTPDANLVVDLGADPIIKLLVAGEEEQGWKDISGPIYRSQKSFDPGFALGVASNAQLTSVSIYSESFQKLDSDFPVTTVGYDFMKMAPAEVEELGRLGLEFRIQDNNKSATITFSESLRKKITDVAGLYRFDLSMKDGKGKSKTQTISVEVANLTVMTLDVNRAEVWTKKVTLRGRILSQEKQNHRFRYKKVSESSWIDIPTNSVTTNGADYTYMLSGLQHNTEYEYQAIDDISDKDALVTRSFKTEEEYKLANNSFEEWSQPAKPMLICLNESEMFWDSGNHGSVTLSKNDNITVYDTGIKYWGEKSIKMMSKSIVGQFAAGNVFIGKYIRTQMDALTGNGVLGWGRPCDSRPTKLHGYVRYETSGGVNGTVAGQIKKGDGDIGIIYIALGDWKGETDIKTGETWPKIIQTDFNNPNNAKLFDPEKDPYIIAYGKQEFLESTDGEGLIEFTIPIDYRTEGRVPTSIILVGSASKFGDYGVGSTNSVMWLDDLELIYDK